MVRFSYPFYPMQWYKNKNPVSGNAGLFNYKVQRQEDILVAHYWLGVWCMEKTKDVYSQSFPLSEEGLQKAVQWLTNAFKATPADQLESRDAFFTTQPYTPPKEKQPEE